MPFPYREAVQLGVLLLCLPLQYYITSFSGSTESLRSYAAQKLVTDLMEFKNNWLQLEPWRKWCTNLISLITEKDGSPYRYTGDDSDMGESPAVEVFRYRDKNGYFGSSPDPRDTRPPHVKYRIGQVIKHKKWGYRGVIIGWDLETRAPEYWIKDMHGENKHWKTQPNYSILVDTRDRATPQMTYVPQETIDVVRHIKVFHPFIEDHFESYDGTQYIPRPWLRAIYPKD